MRYVFILLVPLFALFVLGCGDEETTPTPTHSPAAGGIDAFRRFAREIDAAVMAGDAQFFVDRAVIQQETCTGTEEFGPCSAQAGGTSVSGIPVGVWATDARTSVPTLAYGQRLQEFFAAALAEASDDFGTGALGLDSLAYSASMFPPYLDQPGFMAVVSAIVPPTFLPFPTSEGEPQRVVKVFAFAFQDNQWKFLGEIQAGVHGARWLSGECRECYDRWERGRPTVE